MSTGITAVRGMNDILPSDMAMHAYIVSMVGQIVGQYGYRQIGLPLVESTELFKRSIGDVTDIVEKEMYTFLDRNQQSLSLRPEGTASCVRAGIQHGLFYNQLQRLWYQGPMFRYERPQKGRYRQFYQLGVEAYGMADPAIDAEIILLSATLLSHLGLQDTVCLKLNSLGDQTARSAYKKQLITYFMDYKDRLTPAELKRLQENPLRILDSKNSELQDIIQQSPKITDHLNPESSDHFASLQQQLVALSIPFDLTPSLVRGLDYYDNTVFEWVTDALGAQSAVLAGGRYDHLVEQLGGPITPAIGFAAGIERLSLLCTNVNETVGRLDAYLVVDKCAQNGVLLLADRIRAALPSLTLETDLSQSSLKAQFKRAQRSNARFAIVRGEQEQRADQLTIKPLKDHAQPVTLPFEDAINTLSLALGIITSTK